MDITQGKGNQVAIGGQGHDGRIAKGAGRFWPPDFFWPI